MNTFSKPLACIALCAGIFAAGCKKEPLNNLSNEETRIYVTQVDSSARFQGYKTFSIADSADIIEDNQFLGRQLGPYESGLIAQLSQSLQQRGYTLVPKASNPDLAVNVSEVSNTSTGLFSYSDYWDNYGLYYDPYYWGYPGYGYYPPTFIGSYSIESGGLEVDILDLKNAAANGNKLKLLWSGLVRGEDIFNPANAPAEAKALLEQSSYIKATN